MLTAVFLKNYYDSMQSEILKLQTETKRLQAMEKKLQSFAQMQKKIPNLVELSEENLIAIHESLPEELEQESFTNEIYRTADKNNVAVKSLQIGEFFPADTDKNFSGTFYKQSIKTQIETEYVALLNFLREISDGKRFVTLGNISVDGSEDILNCEVEFFIYSAKNSAQQQVKIKN